MAYFRQMERGGLGSVGLQIPGQTPPFVDDTYTLPVEVFERTIPIPVPRPVPVYSPIPTSLPDQYGNESPSWEMPATLGLLAVAALLMFVTLGRGRR